MARPTAQQRLDRAGEVFRFIFKSDPPFKNAGAALRAFENLLDYAYRATWYHWYLNMLPTNFQPGAAARRGYQARKTSYQRRKAGMTRKDGMPRPALVFRGSWKTLITARPDREPKFRKKIDGFEVSGVVNVPDYVRMNRHIRSMAKEATDIDDRQEDALSRYLADMVLHLMDMEAA